MKARSTCVMVEENMADSEYVVLYRTRVSYAPERNVFGYYKTPEKAQIAATNLFKGNEALTQVWIEHDNGIQWLIDRP
jgi:hypothetical protein